MKRDAVALLVVGLGAVLILGMMTPVRTAIVETAGKWFDALKRLIAGHEGLRLEAYQDPVGLWTIGYGHLIKPGEPYHPYGPVTAITHDEAERLFAHDIADARRCVETNVSVPLTDNQRAALISFVFNVGCENFRRSTLLQHLNSGRTADAAAELDKWTYARGIKLAGLVKRRASERALFESA